MSVLTHLSKEAGAGKVFEKEEKGVFESGNWMVFEKGDGLGDALLPWMWTEKLGQ